VLGIRIFDLVYMKNLVYSIFGIFLSEGLAQNLNQFVWFITEWKHKNRW